jgi:flagellin
MQQLSTGSKINSAADDAAGLAIMQNQTSQVRGLNMAVRNLNDGVNLLQTADGALVESTNMLQRMRELAVQSSNGTLSSTQRGYLSTEFVALSSQIDSIASQTTWNGMNILNNATASAAMSFQSGILSGQSISVTITAMTLSNGLGVTAGVNIAGTVSASAALTIIDSALDKINSQRATLGAGINQMTYATDSIQNISTNVAASRSTIADTDYASASSNLSKAQIVQQAATAMLAQANSQPQSVLALLK